MVVVVVVVVVVLLLFDDGNEIVDMDRLDVFAAGGDDESVTCLWEGENVGVVAGELEADIAIGVTPPPPPNDRELVGVYIMGRVGVIILLVGWLYGRFVDEPIGGLDVFETCSVDEVAVVVVVVVGNVVGWSSRNLKKKISNKIN